MYRHLHFDPGSLVRAILFIAFLALPGALAQGDITRYGNVSLASFGMMGMSQTVASASFYELADATSVPSAEGFYGTDRIETCVVGEQGRAEQPEPPEAAFTTENVTPIEAGSPIEIRSGGSVYASLTRSGDSYMATTSQALPEQAVVEIPGAEGGFPAFSGRAFPPALPIEFTSPENLQNIGADTTFTWTETTELGVVLITMQGTSAGGEDVGIVCFAQDDGEFSLSGRGDLADATVQSVLLYGRNNVETYREGDALLTLSVFSTTLGMQMPTMPTSPQ